MGEGFRGWVVDVGDMDEGSGSDEFPGGGLTNAAGTARDKGVAIVEAKRLDWCC